MRVDRQIGCPSFPCRDVRHDCYLVPSIDINPDGISVVLISEAAPVDPDDYYYAPGEPLFAQTTIQAFNQAGLDVASVEDILSLGVYLTTAVKCGKTGYGIKAATVKECSFVLERELALFSRVKAFLLRAL